MCFEFDAWRSRRRDLNAGALSRAWLKFHTWRRPVQRRKWSPTANDPQTGNDPQIGPQMIPNRKWSPMWTANDPAGKRGMAWSLVSWIFFYFLCYFHIYLSSFTFIFIRSSFDMPSFDMLCNLANFKMITQRTLLRSNSTFSHRRWIYLTSN